MRIGRSLYAHWKVSLCALEGGSEPAFRTVANKPVIIMVKLSFIQSGQGILGPPIIGVQMFTNASKLVIPAVISVVKWLASENGRYQIIAAVSTV
jgi:hypothetical protein